MHLTCGNSKLKKDGIWSFGLVAVLCCPFADKCIKLCYARQGSYGFPCIRRHRLNNFKASQRQDFVEIMCDEIAQVKPAVVRLHDSGDFYSREYLFKWIFIAIRNPNVIFYAYTKSFPLFVGVSLPDNLIVIGSAGGKWPVPDNWPKAIVIPHKSAVPDGHKLGNKSDLDNLIHVMSCLVKGERPLLALRAHGLARNWLKQKVA